MNLFEVLSNKLTKAQKQVRIQQMRRDVIDRNTLIQAQFEHTLNHVPNNIYMPVCRHCNHIAKRAK